MSAKILFPISILVAILAQLILSERALPISLALYLVAIALAVFVAPRELASSINISISSISLRRSNLFRFFALAACVICSVGAFTLNTDASFGVREGIEYQFTLGGVITWVTSIALFIFVFWQPQKNFGEWRNAISAKISSIQNGVHLSATTLALIAVLVLGAFFYFYNLNGIPAEMTSDHAEKLLDVNDILTGHYPVFFPRNTGREPMQFYVTALLIELFNLPLKHIALKIGTAFVGWLTIPATFLLAREIFDDLIGILAAFFVAVMHWATAIARMGLRYPYTPFFAALSLYFIWRAMKYQHRNDFLIAGVVMGAGLYGYIPSRNIPLVALGLFALWAIFDGWGRKIDWKQFAQNIAVMFSGTLVVFLPLLRYTLDYPEMFWYRALTRLSDAEQPIQGNLISVFISNLKNLALMFNWRGDEVWVTNISEQPTLDPFSGALIVLGVVLAIFWLARFRKPVYLYLLAAFTALLLPSALSLAFPNENPSLVRTGGAIPLAAILLVLPLAALVRQNASRRVNVLRYTFVGVIAIGIIALNYRWYFNDFDQNYHKFAQNSSEVAAVIHDFADSIGDLDHAYFIGYPYWIDGRAIAINLGNINWDQYSLDATDFIDNENANRLYILNPSDSANLEILQNSFPHGQIKTIPSPTPGKSFISFFVPAE